MEKTTTILNDENVVFHYTTLDAAIKIILTNTLRFSHFENANDISESCRASLGHIDEETQKKILSEYQFISLVGNAGEEPAFAIDSLWGYYADKGNGICLAFDRNKILAQYRSQYNLVGIPDDLRIEYLDSSNFSNMCFLEGRTKAEAERYVGEHVRNIFFTKEQCWSHEKEIRLLAKSSEELYLDLADSLVGAIIFMPNDGDYQGNQRYVILNGLKSLHPFDICRYVKKLGNKELWCEDDLVWPLHGRDYNLDVGMPD